jgi:hypothetical protein
MISRPRGRLDAPSIRQTHHVGTIRQVLRSQHLLSAGLRLRYFLSLPETPGVIGGPLAKRSRRRSTTSDTVEVRSAGCQIVAPHAWRVVEVPAVGNYVFAGPTTRVVTTAGQRLVGAGEAMLGLTNFAPPAHTIYGLCRQDGTGFVLPG